jgi:hypothetical protein
MHFSIQSQVALFGPLDLLHVCLKYAGGSCESLRAQMSENQTYRVQETNEEFSHSVNNEHSDILLALNLKAPHCSNGPH